jgi:hypothetical protein
VNQSAGVERLDRTWVGFCSRGHVLRIVWEQVPADAMLPTHQSMICGRCSPPAVVMQLPLAA